MDAVSYIIIIAISVIFSAFFSGMKVSFLSANRLKLEMEKKQGGPVSKLVNIFIDNPRRYVAAMQIGTYISSVVFVVFLIKYIENRPEEIISARWLIVTIQILAAFPVILLVTEILPKIVFRQNANFFLNTFAVPSGIFYFLFLPISQFFLFLSEFFADTMFRLNTMSDLNQKKQENTDHSAFSSSESAVYEMNADTQNELQLFHNALDFSDITIRECMVPRNEIVAVSTDADMEDVKEILIQTGFSKIPVYKENIDNIVGYVHTMNVIKKIGDLRASMTTIAAVPETMYADEVLQKLIKLKKSVALVVDEFGGTSGLVTLEDIIEEIFGEIEDEHDKAELYEKQVSEKEYIFSGRLEIDYINSAYNLSLPVSDDYETIAGYILYIKKQIPEPGDIIEKEKFKFEILKTDYPKILRVKLLIDD